MLSTPRRVSRRTQRSTRPAAEALQPRAGAVVPFDAAARFRLAGQPGRIVQDVLNISPDAIFVAVAIGYGFEQERMRPLQLQYDDSHPGGTPPPPDPLNPIPGQLLLRNFSPTAFIDGFHVHPDFTNVIFSPPRGIGGVGGYSDQPVSRDLLDRCFQLVRPLRDITFLFSIVDSSSGRELMDQPEHSLSGLGGSDGERPFRLLANPLQFLPRSTVRLQVIEQTPDVTGTLFIVLYGYKVLVGSSCPEPSADWMAEASVRGSLLNLDGARAIPFDSVAKFELTGRSGNVVEDEITVTTEGAFVVSAIGYGLAVQDEAVKFNADQLPTGDPVDLSKIPLSALPPDCLLDGIRIRPEYLRVALQTGGALASVSLDVVNQIFQRLNRSEDVDFLYTIYDDGTGQAWQNVPLYNVAGLGIANGLRPFKQLAKPAILAPRSTLHITVQEQFGRGVLFLALQGYKRIGAYGIGGRS
jgi:hypothetical protein